MDTKNDRFKGIGRGKNDVPESILQDVSDIVERLSVHRTLDSPEEAIILSLFATTATLAHLCGRYLAQFPVFEKLGILTRIEGLHFLFILYDVTKEEQERGKSLRLTQRVIGMVMKVLGRGNETSIPNALKNAFDEYLEGGAASHQLRLNERGLRLAEEIASQYYPLMEEIFGPTRSDADLEVVSRMLRHLRDNATDLDPLLDDEGPASSSLR